MYDVDRISHGKRRSCCVRTRLQDKRPEMIIMLIMSDYYGLENRSRVWIAATAVLAEHRAAHTFRNT